MLVLLPSTIKVKFDQTKSKVFSMAQKALLIWPRPHLKPATLPMRLRLPATCLAHGPPDTPCHTASPLWLYSLSFLAGNALAPSVSLLSHQTQSRYHPLWKHFWSSPACVSWSTLKFQPNLRLTSLRALWPWAQDLTSLISVSSSVKWVMVSTWNILIPH